MVTAGYPPEEVIKLLKGEACPHHGEPLTVALGRCPGCEFRGAPRGWRFRFRVARAAAFDPEHFDPLEDVAAVPSLAEVAAMFERHSREREESLLSVARALMAERDEARAVAAMLRDYAVMNPRVNEEHQSAVDAARPWARKGKE